MNTRIFLLGMALLCSSPAFSQKTETIVLKKEPNQGQTIIEIKDGRILVDGREVSTYPKGKNEVAKKIVIDGAGDAPDGMEWPGFGNTQNTRAVLGVLTRSDSMTGALITNIKPGSAAEKAGLKAGDRILAIDATGIESPEALVEKMGSLKAGDEITVRYRREGSTESTKAILQAAPRDLAPFPPYGPFGGNQMPNHMPFSPRQMPQLSPGDLEDLQQLLEQFQMPGQGPKLGIGVEERQDGDGILIKTVTAGSPAEKAGLQPGDILTHWNGNVITNISTLQQQVQGAKTGKKIEVRYLRHGKPGTAQVLLTAPAKRAEL